MRLSPSKFEALSEVLVLNNKSPSAPTMASLFQIPALLKRGRMVVQGFADRDLFIADLSAIYKHLKVAKSFVYKKYMISPSTDRNPTGPYGFCLAFSCIFNCMLRGVEHDNAQLLLEAEDLVRDTLGLVPEVQKSRPLGAGHMMLNLSAAWLCARDENERQVLYSLLEDFSWDFRRDAHTMWPVEDLEALLCDLQYQTDPDILLAHAA